MASFWKKISSKAQRVGNKVLHIWTLIFLTLMYFTVFAVTALLLRLFGKRQLIMISKKQPSFWVNRPEMKHTIDEMKRQF